MKLFAALASAVAAFLTVGSLHAQTPPLLNYQGRVVVGTANFDGTGQFKFALVSGTGPTLLWKNDGSPGNTEPATAVSLAVTKGLYSVLLGDTSMTAIPASVFANPDLRLRVWFNDGTNGWQLLTPDQRVVASPYLADGSVTSAKIAPNAVGSTHIAAGAVGGAQLAPGAVQIGNIAIGAVGPAQIANGAIGSIQFAADVGLWTASGSNIFRNGGNVGIGTTNPLAPLDVAGSALFSGNVGIGTTAPGASLDVLGWMRVRSSGPPSPASLGLEFGVHSGSLPAYSWIQSHESRPLALNPLGSNVGIGTAEPGYRLDVVGAVSATPITNGVIRILGTGSNPATGFGGGLLFAQEDSLGTYSSYASITGRRVDNAINNRVDLDFNTGTPLDLLPLGTRMTITAAGNVGIGTTSPGDKLSLGFGGSISLDASDSTQTTRLRWRYQGDEYAWIERVHPSGALAFGADGIERMRIQNGNVGIGTTTPGTKLHLRDQSIPTNLGGGGVLTIAGADVGSGPNVKKEILFKTWGNAANAHGIVGIETVDAAGAEAGDLYFAMKSGTGDVPPTEKMRITNGGNVGIGTTNPLAKFQVSGGSITVRPLTNTDGFIALNAGGSDYPGYIDFYKNGPARIAYLGYNGPGSPDLGLYLENAANFVVNGGNVGIGTTNPTARLDVAGTVRATAFLGSGSGLFGINAAAIVDNAITTAKIADGAVTLSKIAVGAVDTSQLAPNAVQSASIANNAVTTSKLADGSVTAAKLSASSVGSTHLATSAVATGNIAGNAVTSTKLASDAASLAMVSGGLITTLGPNVGFGTVSPTTTVDVAGKVRASRIQITTAAAAGYVLTSNGDDGNSDWKPAPAQLPNGVIVMWSGSLASIPSGWALCNGANGTPDLRDRFVQGVSTGQNPGSTGGSASHSHTVSAHTHSVSIPQSTTSTAGSHSHDFFVDLDTYTDLALTYAPGTTFSDSFIYGIGAQNSNTGVSGSHSHTVPSQLIGTGAASPGTDAQGHLPPYYKIAFIMKL